MNLNFYPGPSKLYPSVEGYLLDAYRSGILSMNHRSGAFMEMLSETIGAFKEKLAIPTDYEVYFTSSATECWEIITQSLVEKGSLHLYNGAFGQKWYEYAKRLNSGCVAYPFDLEEVPDIKETSLFQPADLLCLTHNETSNGTALPEQIIKSFRELFSGIIAIDATSSMGGVELPWQSADVWFASLQKCFGLPSGMGVMVVSPKAIQKAEQKGDRNYYNSLLFIRENFLKNQTPHTPNILGIYLLGKVMQEVEPIERIGARIQVRAEGWYSCFEKLSIPALVQNPEVRSQTVIVLQGLESFIQKIKKNALAQGIIIGNGYGKWKSTTLRIANFPAISGKDIESLKDLLNHSI